MDKLTEISLMHWDLRLCIIIPFVDAAPKKTNATFFVFAELNTKYLFRIHSNHAERIQQHSSHTLQLYVIVIRISISANSFA